MDYFLLIAGLAVLVLSGEVLVKGAVGIALRLRISTLVVGMTVVSFGTSAPELLVSLQASLSGNPAIAIGNVVGSNIANLALVLGLTALVLPLPVERDSLRIDWPVMMSATILLILFIFNGTVNRIEGGLLFGLLILFTVWLIRRSRKNAKSSDENEAEPPSLWHLFRDLGLVVLGCVGLVFGADWLLEGAVNIAESYGVSKHVIGVTIVAFGTSVPELVTSLVAAFRKQSDISIGNLVGSNLFNIMAILGITAMVKDIPVEEIVIQRDIWWVFGVSLLLLPLMLIGRKIGRWQGILLFSIYIAYLLMQVFSV
ncbi:MAG: calcium/sodium antiporter [Salibacteraceae bacterium]